jgi:hypothetical protein
VPTQWAHTFYWEVSSTVVAPPPTASATGGYPAWQGGVVMGSGFGAIVAMVLDWLSCLVTIMRGYYKLGTEDRAVVTRTMTYLAHPAYPVARLAVRKTSKTLGFNRPEAWKELSRELKSDPKHAENAFRHLEACRLVRANLLNSTVTNPELHLITELAYHGFTVNPRG